MYQQARKTYVGGGKPPPEQGYDRLYHSPEGMFPKLIDVALRYGMFKPNIHRRYANPSDDFTEWYVIHQPTEQQQIEAISNVNSLYLELYEAEDTCSICNHVDDMIFTEGCWLLAVDHDHSSPETKGVLINYLYLNQGYTVTYDAWQEGSRPHK